MFLLVLPFVFLPLLSLALPSSHPRSLHRRAPSPPRIIAYYPDWAPPESMDYSLYDLIIFAFALPDQNYHLAWDTDQAPTLLQSIIPLAHAKSTKVSLSIGGWTGSRYFSDAVSTARNRDTFANNILDAYNRYNLDGIDIDWEYPGQIGQQGNSERASDYDNMLQFFKVLKQKLPPDALVSAAVQVTPFAGSDGQPIKDVSYFSKLVDFITVMNYDVHGTQQPPGPNAPLANACGNSSQPTQNAVGSYDSWTSAGFPASQIVLGVPAYGYVVSSSAERLSARSALRAYPEGGSGQIQFRSLVNQGILVKNPNGSFTASGGFIRNWDDCSATPYLRSNSATQVISYDDPESLALKASWIRDMGLAGVNLFDVHGDTSQHDLTLALRANLFPAIAPSATLSSAVSSSATALSILTFASTAASSPNPHPTPSGTPQSSVSALIPPLLGIGFSPRGS